tara:strand:- start:60160 stop:60732 length:573 start_codon:yes stop_codon:yes gene_type:complete
LQKGFPWLKKEEQLPTKHKKIFLRGDLVVLRDKTLEDISNDYRWRSDRDLASLDATHPLRMSYEEFYSYERDELIYENPTSKRFSIDTLNGVHIGNCMYYGLDWKKQEVEVGILIGDEKYLSKGYGTDAMNILIKHVFDTKELNRIYLHTLDWNTRARKAFSKSGLQEIDTISRNGMKFILMEVFREQII